MDCRWWWWRWLCLCCQNKHFVDFLWTIIHPLYRANCDGEIIWLNWMCVPGNWKRVATGSKLEMEWDLMSKQSGGRRRRWWICERVVEWSWKGVEIYVFSVKTVRVTLPQYPQLLLDVKWTKLKTRYSVWLCDKAQPNPFIVCSVCGALWGLCWIQFGSLSSR